MEDRELIKIFDFIFDLIEESLDDLRFLILKTKILGRIQLPAIEEIFAINRGM